MSYSITVAYVLCIDSCIPHRLLMYLVQYENKRCCEVEIFLKTHVCVLGVLEVLEVVRWLFV